METKVQFAYSTGQTVYVHVDGSVAEGEVDSLFCCIRRDGTVSNKYAVMVFIEDGDTPGPRVIDFTQEDVNHRIFDDKELAAPISEKDFRLYNCVKKFCLKQVKLHANVPVFARAWLNFFQNKTIREIATKKSRIRLDDILIPFGKAMSLKRAEMKELAAEIKLFHEA